MDRVGRYQLLDKLGEGGMGVVYKAYDPLIQRVVAVKLINSARTDDPVLRERFFAEARAAGHLSHRNIVTVYDLGEDNGRPFFAMEFLEGQDLGRMIRSGQPSTLTAKIDLMAQAGRGLAYAHARGVVHRDVKPANIFVTTAGDVKVLDFGLARLARPLGSDLTRTRPFVGTVSYMAPEQVRGEPADARTDLFAFGVVLYEMLSGGRSAFETDSFASTMHRILTEEPEPLDTLNASVPAELVHIVDRALAKSRDHRYQRVDDMLADLAVFRASLNVAPEPLRASSDRPPYPRATTPRGPSLDGLDTTIGHEAAVEVHTPPPRDAPALLSPVGSVTPLPSAPVAVHGRRRAWAWAAALAAAAALSAIVVWRAVLPAGAPADAAPGVAASVGPAGTASGVAAGPAVPPRPDPSSTGAAGSGGDDGGEGAAKGPGAAVSRSDAAVTDKRRETAGRATALLAQGALVDAARARARAESAAAGRLAPELYARALEAERAASDRFRAGAFEQARSGFTSVAVLFEKAESFARAEEARQAEEERMRQVPPAPAPSPDVPPIPAPTSPAPTSTSSTPGTSTSSTPGTSTSSTPGTSTSGTPGTSTSSTSSTPGTSTSGTPGTPGTPGTTRDAALSLLSRYASALESRSLTRLKQVWPSLGGAQERAIADEFQHARSIVVTLRDVHVDVQDAAPTVSCRRTYRLETKDGQRLETDTRTVFLLRQAAAGWVIEQVRHEQR